MINHVNVVGYVGATPRFTTFTTGKKVVNFSVAVDQGKRDGQDMEPLWLDIEAWEQVADNIRKFNVDKGTKISLVGPLLPNKYRKEKDNVVTEVRGVRIKMTAFEIMSKRERIDDNKSDDSKTETLSLVAEPGVQTRTYRSRTAKVAK